MTEGIWVALIILSGTLAGVASGFVGMLVGRRKLKAEAADQITQAALSLVEPLERRVNQLENKVARYERGIEILIAQLRRMGCNPDWTPEMTAEIPTQPRKGGDD